MEEWKIKTVMMQTFKSTHQLNSPPKLGYYFSRTCPFLKLKHLNISFHHNFTKNLVKRTNETMLMPKKSHKTSSRIMFQCLNNRKALLKRDLKVVTAFYLQENTFTSYFILNIQDLTWGRGSQLLFGLCFCGLLSNTGVIWQLL